MIDNTDLESISAFRAEFFAVFNRLRENNQFCDVAIVTEGGTLNAHKNVLSAASPYFLKLFTLPVIEADMKEIRIPEFSFATMEQIIQFIYTGKLNISIEAMPNILDAANFLQIADLVDFCGSYILKSIEETNCFQMRDLLKRANCDGKIIGKADDYINSNFQQISQNDAFLQLDLDSVLQLLSSTELCRASEEDVRHGAIRWLSANTDRKKHTQEIFTCIRLSLLPNNFNLLHIANSSPNKKDIIISQKSILAIRHGRATSIQLFDPSAKKWTKIMDIEPKRYLQVASDDRRVIVAGTTKESSLCFFNVLDLNTKQWTSLPSLQVVKMGIRRMRSLQIVGEKLYVFSETFGFIWMHVLDLTTNCWDSGERIENDSCFTEFAALGKYIYAFDNSSFGVQRISQKLDTETKKWSNIEPMIRNQRRAVLHGATTQNGKIFVSECSLYGRDGEIARRYADSFDVYDPVKDEWKKLTRMTMKMMGVALVGTTEGIYAIGRTNKSAPSMVQFYDVQKDEWRIESDCPEEFEGKKVLACAVQRSYFSG